MLKVLLYVHEIELGYLTEIDKGYVFKADAGNVAKAKKEYPIEMKRFTLNSADNGLYREVPPIFDEFLGYTSRQDLIEEAGIDKFDTDLEKIYKLAGLDMMTPVFEIRQG